jgi:hypothetical protein
MSRAEGKNAAYDGVASGWKPGMWRCGLRGAGGRRFGGFGMPFLR